MGLFGGKKEDPEDLIYQAMSLLQKNQSSPGYRQESSHVPVIWRIYQLQQERDKWMESDHNLNVEQLPRPGRRGRSQRRRFG